jgi:anaphase-promoting complex subunit 3
MMVEALKAYEKAEHLRPDIHIYKFRRASTLFSLNRLQESLNILEHLSETDPGESNVFFLMGKVYAKLGQNEQAMSAFTIAQDVSGPKSISVIHDEIGKHLLLEMLQIYL